MSYDKETDVRKEDSKMYGAMQGAMQSEMARYNFKNRLKNAAEQGLLIFVKWGLALVLAYLAINVFTNLMSGASNGTQSAIYLNQLQQKGYLPAVVNGVVPDLPKKSDGVNENATPSK